MSQEDDDRAKISDRLNKEQSEANQNLVLATLRAHEDADAAREETVSAEARATVLRANEVELLATAEFRERMIGILGHDLRTPLNTIVMGSGLLLGHGRLAPADAHIVGLMINSSHRMSRMIDQLLEFTRARLGGGFSLELRAADLGEICRNASDELRLASPAVIEQSVEGDVTGTWDADRLSEVISNIAGNAVGHARPGTPVTIRVRVAPAQAPAEDAAEERVVCAISNQGADIPAELLREIFLPFRREQGSQAHGTGHLGLGLYIAHEIMHSHGGTLTVRSAGGTTTFIASLPRVPPHDSAEP